MSSLAVDAVNTQPSLRVVPDYDSDHLGHEAVAFARGYRQRPDPWQVDGIVDAMVTNGDVYAASTVAWDVARQNGKNLKLEIRELFGMAILGEKILHTAHEVKTARKAFRRLKFYFGKKVNDPGAAFPELNAMVTELRSVNGQEAIYLNNGGAVEFIARSSSSGRGFEGMDVLVCDEAQELTDDELAALLPTISAATLGNPQMIFAGTPPDPDKRHLAKGEVFRRTRKLALEGGDGETAFRGYGVPDGPLPDVNDDELVLQANPGTAGPRGKPAWREIRNERKVMAAATFARERLGWWGEGDDDDLGPIDIVRWFKLANAKAKEPSSSCIVLDVSPDRKLSTIGVAGDGSRDGKILVMVISRPGTDWVVPRLKKLLKKRDVVEVALHPAKQASVLIPELVRGEIDYQPLTRMQVGQATGWFIKEVASKKRRRIEHLGQQLLDDAVANAKTRIIDEQEVWDPRVAEVPISPLVAGSVAAHRWSLVGDYDVMDSIG